MAAVLQTKDEDAPSFKYNVFKRTTYFIIDQSLINYIIYRLSLETDTITIIQIFLNMMTQQGPSHITSLYILCYILYDRKRKICNFKRDLNNSLLKIIHTLSLSIS